MSDTPVHGTVEPGFEPVRDVFDAASRRASSARRCARTSTAAKSSICGAAGRTPPDARVAARHDRLHVLGDEGNDRHVRPPTRRSRSARRGRTRRHLLARVRAGRQGNITVRMVLSHQAGLPWTTVPYPPEKRLDWETITQHSPDRRPVGARHAQRVPRRLVRLPRRRGRAADRRPLARRVLPRGDRRAARCRLHDRRRPGTRPSVRRDRRPDDMVGAATRREWRAAGDGAATGHGTADGLARVYAALRAAASWTVCRCSGGDHRSRHAGAAAGARRRDRGDFGLGYQLLWKMFPVGRAAVRTHRHGRLDRTRRPDEPARLRVRDEPAGQRRGRTYADRDLRIARRVGGVASAVSRPPPLADPMRDTGPPVSESATAFLPPGRTPSR